MILVTGATGFIGRHLCAALSTQGRPIRMSLRKPPAMDDVLRTLGDIVVTGALDADTDWRAALQGVDAVVHLASRVHQMNESNRAVEDKYHRSNVLGTRALAAAAREAGVERFVFISSVKAVGECGDLDAASVPAPLARLDAYGRSKLAAEQALHEVASGSGMAVTVLRLPLVYGPGVGANFLRLLRIVDRRLPLPLASANNRRSLLYSGNLVSAIVQVLSAQPPVRGTFFVSDGESLSTPELIRAIAVAMNKDPNLWPCPLPLLRWLSTLAGRRAELSRLTDSLVIDDRPLCDALSWTPPYTLTEGLRATMDWYSRQP